MAIKYTGTTGGDTHIGIVNEQNNMFGLGGHDVLGGGDLSDYIEGGDGYDTLSGLGGSDTLDGGAGNDKLDGGDGGDWLLGGDGDDKLFGGASDDILNSGIGNDELDAGTGDDVIYLGGQAGDLKTVVAGAGDDEINAGLGKDVINGGAGEDLVRYNTAQDKVTVDLLAGLGSQGAAGDVYGFIENVIGSGYDDVLIGNGTYNVLKGNNGNDLVRGGAGGDHLDGGGNIDTLDYRTSDLGVTIDLAKGTASGGDAQGDQFYSFENVTGSEVADLLAGDAGANVLSGRDGNDRLTGGAGADQLQGGAGDDTASYAGAAAGLIANLADATANSGDAFGDVYTSIENLIGSTFGDQLLGNASVNAISGGDGNDTLSGGAGGDKLSGGAGTDTASYSGAAQGLTGSLADVSVNSGDAKGDSYSSIENLAGSAFADKLFGNSSANVLSGGDGNDTLTGGGGADALKGGSGSDTASYAGAAAGVVANLVDASVNSGDAEGDSYSSIENLTGTSFADTLTGSTASNILMSGSGNDILTGGGGADRLYGQGGTDTFVFKALVDSTVAEAGRDTIFDFSHAAGDRIDLSAIDAVSDTSGNQAFSFKGTAAFTGKDGELRFVKAESDTYIYGDINGDKTADFSIHVDGAVTLVAGDFIL